MCSYVFVGKRWVSYVFRYVFPMCFRKRWVSYVLCYVFLCVPLDQDSEVAFSVGFHDQSNFNRMFRRMAGMSPMQFRRTMPQRTPGEHWRC
jgi:hypothetical protein